MKQWEQVMRDKKYLRRIPDYQGRPMYTPKSGSSLIFNSSSAISANVTTIIDATEGGAMKRGTKVMTLARALEDFCAQKLNGSIPVHLGLRWDRIGQCIASLEARKREAQQIQKITGQTLPMLEEVRDHLEDQQRVNKINCPNRSVAISDEFNGTMLRVDHSTHPAYRDQALP